ncbi:MAG: glycerol-3-phosphate dehydrogenase [Bacteroidales bacterium]|jgi:glycerol-3-phosphate dehydrogenase (NAD(P)+)|nr:glycerol-3-phosphate dehydrogenase [Bacteroidales bacterium]
MKGNFNKNTTYAVIGSGSWATALVKILLDTQEEVVWFVRDQKMISFIDQNKHNPHYLQAVELDTSRLLMSCDINKIISQGDVLIFCIPSTYFISEMLPMTVSLEDKFIVTAIKGLIPESNISITEYFKTIHNIPYDNMGVIAGPVHAEEVAMERLSYLSITCKKERTAKKLAQAFRCPYIRTSIGTDIYGLEYSVVLKNIYAIASGMSRALGYGDNFQAVLVSCAYQEIRSFLNRSYPDKGRNTSLSGFLGDLLVTCYSQFSRNRTFGNMIGQGYSIKAAQLEMNMVAEGYYATLCIHEINKKYKAEMPIAEAMYKILHEFRSPAIVFKALSEQLK